MYLASRKVLASMAMATASGLSAPQTLSPLYHKPNKFPRSLIRASCKSAQFQTANSMQANPFSLIPLAAKAATGVAAALLIAGAPAWAADDALFQIYFGTAASASSYGGYGGNTSKKDAAEYVYDVPQGWKERQISKVEKGTNGTDSEFYNPKKKTEKVYVTYLAGIRKLGPKDNVLNDLALSDVSLQDMLSMADSIDSKDKSDENGQLYYDFEIDSPVAHSLISVTCAKNKLYAHFVKAPVADWNRDQEILRHIHQSFGTVGAPSPVASR